MKHLLAFTAACGLISVAACTARDSLLDETGAGAGQGGGGTVPGQAGSGHSAGDAGSKGGGPSMGGSAADGAEGGGPDVMDDECPPGQMWCPGCNVGEGSCAAGCPAVACEPCAEVTTEEECDERIGCHSVFREGVCACASPGCCMEFAVCADGDLVDCQGRNVSCDAPTPVCGPMLVNSYSGYCYEGCVAPQDCAAPVCPEITADGCRCYSDTDCSSDQRCYSADCANGTAGTCRVPPPEGCFGDADCPSGQTCIGGRPALCGTTMADGLGTCGVEACPEGDCSGTTGPTCTCSDGDQCVSATGPAGSGQCRGADGTCSPCKCASPDTPIATPGGERRIADLRPGDLVYSVDHEAIRTVPVLRVNRTPVVGHHVLRVSFANGRFIEMTAEHPLADGRPLSALSPHSALMGGVVASITRVAYEHPATYDILPDSTSGAYFASGVLIGSTLAGSQWNRASQATAR